MNWEVIVIIFCIAFFIGYTINMVYQKEKVIRSFEKYINEFLEYYQKFKEIMDSDFNVEEIVDYIVNDNNDSKDEGTMPIECYFTLDDMVICKFKDSAEMRRAFLLAGEFILKYEEKILAGRQKEDIMKHPEKYDEFLRNLKQIRIIALSKNEKTNLSLR